MYRRAERDGPDHVRPLHLERDLLAAFAHPAAVHLAERRRGNGQRALVQTCEDLARRHTQLALDEPQRVDRRVGGHGVAQLLQLVHRRRWQQVGPDREHLPTLNEGRAEAHQQVSKIRRSRAVELLTLLGGSGSARGGGVER
jgi:hypothetical protein